MTNEKIYSIEKPKPQIRELTLEQGLDYPTNEELAMLILGSGTKQKPVEILAIEAIRAIEGANPKDYIAKLLEIDGIGSSKALLMAAAIELGRRLNRNPQVKLRSPCEIVPYVKNYAMQTVEHFLTLTLNGLREILSIRVCAVGSGNAAVLNAREIFSEPVKEHASAVIFCHNHPSGSLEPSEYDISLTNRMQKAAEILGIVVLDHIIITKTGYFSFLEHDLLEKSNVVM